MNKKCPFQIGDYVVYDPSARGYDLVDGERLEKGKSYTVKEIIRGCYVVVEGYNHPGGGIYWTEFNSAE